MSRSTASRIAPARCSAISLGVPAQPTSLWLDGRTKTVQGRAWDRGIGVWLLRAARKSTASRVPDVVHEGRRSGLEDARRPSEIGRIGITRSTTLPAGLVCLIAASGAAYGVYVGAAPTGPFVAYLLALAAGGLALGTRPAIRPPRPTRDLLLIGVLAAAQLVSIVAFTRQPFHFHYDEFITAYASWELPRIDRIDWFRGYPGADYWQAHFPIIWFALQKPFLIALGPSVDAIRISTWPYHVAIVAYLYWLARALLADRTMAVVATAAFVVLAPSAYLAGLGVYFGGSTLALLAALYHEHRLPCAG